MWRLLFAVLLVAAPVGAQVPDYLVMQFDIRNASGVFDTTQPTDVTDTNPPTMAVSVDPPSPGVRQPGLIIQFPTTITQFHCDATTEWTSVQGINRRLDTVGWCQAGTVVTGFYRTALGEIRRLAVPGAWLTEAHAINHGRTVVGVYQDSADTAHGFLWHPRRGVFTQLDVPFPEGSITVPMAINTAGHIVGIYHSPLGRQHGFLYQPATATWTSIDAPGADVTTVFGINDAGVIIGRSDSFREGVSLFFYQEGVFTTITVPQPMAVATVDLWGISNRGLLIGTIAHDTGPALPDENPPSITRGFLATPLPQLSPTVAPLLVASAQPLLADTVVAAPATLGGCPGDKQRRHGKLRASWVGCARLAQ